MPDPSIRNLSFPPGLANYRVDDLQKGHANEFELTHAFEHDVFFKALQKSEEKYKELFTSIHDSILVVNHDRTILDANPAFTRLFGYDLSEIKGKKPNFVYADKNDFASVGRTFQRAKENKFVIPRIVFRKKNGEHFTGEVTFYKLKHQDGSTTGFIGLVRDITATLKAEEDRAKLLEERVARVQAETAKKQLMFLANASSILTASLDYTKTLATVAKLVVPEIADWCSVDMLDNCDEMQNIVIAHSDPHKLKWGILLREHYPLKPTDSYGMYHVLKTGESEFYPTFADLEIKSRVTRFQLNLIERVGIHSAMIVPLSGHNRIFGTISFVRAETKRPFTTHDLMLASELAKRAGSAIENARLYEQANEGIRARDEFLNTASHELKTPLTSLQLQMQLLQKALTSIENGKTDQTSNLLKSSERQVKRLAHLVNDLLEVSRISSHKLQLEREQIELQSLIANIISRIADQPDNSSQKIIFHSKTPIHGYWDRERIDRAVTNLISNAVKYGHGKPIEIRLKKTREAARISITDHGIGIDKEELVKIFDRFERSTQTKPVGGLGLGLYIVKKIVEAHGGSITVKTKIGKGTCFTVLLPLHV